MRTVVYAETGGPEVLHLTDEPLPEPGPGELRVRVVRSGVNPTDWKSRVGRGPGKRLDPPQVPGQDGAGVVEAVGEGVPASWLGLDVWVWEAAFRRRWGTTSEQTLVRSSHLAPLPSRRPGGADHDLGAALGIPFLTAHRCLTVSEEGPLRLGPGTLAGRTVLVTGVRARSATPRSSSRAGPTPPSSPRSAARPRAGWRRRPARTTSSTTARPTSSRRCAGSRRTGSTSSSR